METDWSILWKCIHPTKSSVYTRRHHGGSRCCMHGIHDPAIEDTSLEEIRRRLRVQLSITHYHHHRISSACFPPNRIDHELHLPGNHLYRPHTNSGQLLTHLRDNTKLAADHQQPQHTLRCYGRIDTDRVKFELGHSYHGRTTLISQRQSPQQSGKRARHGSTETFQV